MEGLGIILVIIIAIGFYLFRINGHDQAIREKVNSLGGNVINIERRTFRTGPFILPGKGKIVYRVEYRLDGIVKEGWVKFGGLLGPDWRL